jgi:ubiquinone/menaquinone biosynthesis C-methylase UbiE
MGAFSKLLGQCRKPTGRLGRFIIWTFNIHHSKGTDWALQNVSIEKNATILDVGCGGGRTVYKLAGIASQGKVYGIDYSEECVAASRRTNERLVQAGRVEIRSSSVSALPFPDNTFDLVTAVETHFFWPDLVADMREVLRALKPGGKLMIISESYKGMNHGKALEKLSERMNFPFMTIDEHRELFAKAGYSDVQLVEKPDKTWIYGVGTKPIADSPPTVGR